MKNSSRSVRTASTRFTEGNARHGGISFFLFKISALLPSISACSTSEAKIWVTSKGNPCPCLHVHSLLPVLLQYQPSALGIQNQGWPPNAAPGAGLCHCGICISHCPPSPPELCPQGHSGCWLRKGLSRSSEVTILHFFSNTTDKRRQVTKGQELVEVYICQCKFRTKKKDANSPGGENTAERQQTDIARCCCPSVPPLQPGQTEPSFQGFRVPQALLIVSMPFFLPRWAPGCFSVWSIWHLLGYYRVKNRHRAYSLLTQES